MKVPTVADTILLPLLPLQIFKITRYISLQFYLSIKGLSLISVTSDFLLVLVHYLYTLVYSFTYQLKVYHYPRLVGLLVYNKVEWSVSTRKRE